MRMVRLLVSACVQAVSWAGVIAYLLGIPSPLDISDAPKWVNAIAQTPAVIALCATGIIVTGPLLWTSGYWWPRLVAAVKRVRNENAPDPHSQNTFHISADQTISELAKFERLLPHIERCRRIIAPYSGTLGVVNIGLQVFHSGGARLGEIATELEYLDKQLSALGIHSPPIWGDKGDSFDKVKFRLWEWSLHLAKLEAKIHQRDLEGARG